MIKIKYYVLLLFTTSHVQCLAQYSLPGELDTSFNYGMPHSIATNLSQIPLGFGFPVNANTVEAPIKVRPNGKILVAGLFNTFNGTPTNSSLIQINPDGTRDTTFFCNFQFQNHFTYGGEIVILPNGKTIVGSLPSMNPSATAIINNGVARLNEDGSYDSTFVVPDSCFLSGIVALQSDGKLIVSATTFDSLSNRNNGLIRLNQSGTFDSTFFGAKNIGYIFKIEILNNGKVVVLGTPPSSLYPNVVYRLNTNGTLNTTFTQSFGLDGIIWTIAKQADQKILVGGWFSTYNGVNVNTLVRLNDDGTVDTTFANGFGMKPGVFSIIPLNDGRMFVTGDEPSSLGYADPIFLLNPDGQIDTLFNPFCFTNGVIDRMALQPDGKIVFIGRFTRFNTVWRFGIARVWGVNTTVGIQDETLGRANPVLYPNPAKGEVWLDETLPGHYQLLDLQGRKLIEGIVTGESRQRIDLRQVSPGLYLIRLSFGRQSSTYKLVVE